MAWLTQLLTGGLLGKVTEIIKVFTGDRSKRESGFHEESIASREQFATEFRVSRGGIIESIMDALNRLPRPILVGMVIWYFALAKLDPEEPQQELSTDG